MKSDFYAEHKRVQSGAANGGFQSGDEYLGDRENLNLVDLCRNHYSKLELRFVEPQIIRSEVIVCYFRSTAPCALRNIGTVDTVF